MPIEIKVLKQFESVPAGLYPARHLNDKEQNFVVAAFNLCKDAQIIDGPYAGEILPYSAYIVTGELPAQADLLQVKEKLINDLTVAGQKVTEYARKTGRLQQRVEFLEEERWRLASRIVSLEKENRELKEAIEAKNWATDELNKELEALQQEIGNLKHDKAAALRTEVQAIIEKKIEINYPFGASNFVNQLTDDMCDFIQQREALPF
ncbi:MULTISPECIES: hypothetical protein [unclassified Paenibacillus]|uniref:hypothetical protein n=1 Tax=unclassified Paenibacillus TaxID=185978 RepID=UPI00240689DE|nr:MULTISPECIES: hypothetical protein [unclassified Paenibacillus]MDF9844179.1 putative RNase H-like nuclease (RuvC/YqgF family) [Paenibacillus sp. PastF-2]MDF9850699.1 putative RNase H-like nuclease (RuvC/YqgF family) [Paenibacillus sp. PastM-2]MDF9857270.1 putative RNase H-like nuclease (RuvC/YqgF family) [Paenibacillus sp. PastF-1]MDH6482622.1 putative RNase H-like nuclease (RuvC/YqgF family) [Paenibacillus sp. PastH-2]MDH6510049.1 putative RNase H-like nuclease (RuvC/YqgF family) [Paenibac